MASSFILCRLCPSRSLHTSHLLHAPPPCPERQSFANHHSRRLSSSPSPHLISRRGLRPPGLLLAFVAAAGDGASGPLGVQTAVDAASTVGGPSFVPNIANDAPSVAGNGHGSSTSSSLPSPGQTANGQASATIGEDDFELNYKIYASNTMDDFGPPPATPIPFGGPFEEYYDVVIGEDYIPKQEKPTSSLLMFLDELNAKQKAMEEEKAKNASKPLFGNRLGDRPLFSNNRPLFSQNQPAETTRSISEQRAPPSDNRPLFSQTSPSAGTIDQKPSFAPTNLIGGTREQMPLASQTSQPQRTGEGAVTIQTSTESTPPVYQSKPNSDQSPQTSMPSVSHFNHLGANTGGSPPVVAQSRSAEKAGFSSGPPPLTPQIGQSQGTARGTVSMQESTEPPPSVYQSRSVQGSSDQLPTFPSPPSIPKTRPMDETSKPSFSHFNNLEANTDRRLPAVAQSKKAEEARFSSRPPPLKKFIEGETGPMEEIRMAVVSTFNHLEPNTDSSLPAVAQSRDAEETGLGSRPPSPLKTSVEGPAQPLYSIASETSPRANPPQMEPLVSSEDSKIQSFSHRSVSEPYDNSRTLVSNSEVAAARSMKDMSGDGRLLYPQTSSLQGPHDNSSYLAPGRRIHEGSSPGYPQSKPIDKATGSEPVLSQNRLARQFMDNRLSEGATDSRNTFSKPLEEATESSRPSSPQWTDDSNRQLVSQTGPFSQQSRFGEPVNLAFPESSLSFNQHADKNDVIDIIPDKSSGVYQSAELADINKVNNKAVENPLIGGRLDTGGNAGSDVLPIESTSKDIVPLSSSLLGFKNQVQVGSFIGTSVATDRAAITGTSDGSAEPISVSQYYEPKKGDIVLGVVVGGNDSKLDLEIGAEEHGLLSFRDFQTLPMNNLENGFFSLEDNSEVQGGFVAPTGRHFLLEDKAVYDSASQADYIDNGTILLAEVQDQTILGSKAILSCRSVSRRFAWHRIKQIMQAGEPIEIEIMQFNDGGLLGFLEGIRAFLPRSELLRKPESTAALKDYVGRALSVSVIQVDEEQSNIIISEVKPWMHKNLQLGSVHDVIVTRLYPYGIQVEIKDTRIRGFVHISNLSREYVRSVTDVFSEGEAAKVMLIKGRNPQQVSFSIADLESESGLIFRDKARVYREAEEMARKSLLDLTEDRQIFGSRVIAGTNLEFPDLTIANFDWLHLSDKISSET